MRGSGCVERHANAVCMLKDWRYNIRTDGCNRSKDLRLSMSQTKVVLLDPPSQTSLTRVRAWMNVFQTHRRSFDLTTASLWHTIYHSPACPLYALSGVFGSYEKCKGLSRMHRESNAILRLKARRTYRGIRVSSAACTQPSLPITWATITKNHSVDNHSR